MKMKKLIITIIVIFLGIGLGFGIYYASNNKKNNDKKNDNIPENSDDSIIEDGLNKEEAILILKEKYNENTYLIEFDFGDYDLYFFNIRNLKTNLIEMSVSINKYTKEIRENKTISVGDDNSQIEILGKK